MLSLMLESAIITSSGSGNARFQNRTSIYQPSQPGLKFPEEPKFNSNEELRLDRKKRLVAACHAFSQLQYNWLCRAPDDQGPGAPRTLLDQSDGGAASTGFRCQT